MSLPHLSLADARNLHLAAQGLLNKPRRRASLEDIPATISRMSLLQIDTINIVARSPYLVLFSRLGNYPAQWLDESLARGDGAFFRRREKAQRYFANGGAGTGVMHS